MLYFTVMYVALKACLRKRTCFHCQRDSTLLYYRQVLTYCLKNMQSSIIICV